MKNQKVNSPVSLVTAALFLLSAASAFATTGTWNGSADATWANGTNWTTGTPGATTGTTNADTATFSAATPNFGTGANPVIVDSGRNLENITFDTTAGAYVIGTTGGNALTLTAGGTIQNASTLTSGNTETINAPLTLEGGGGGYTIANNSVSPASGLKIGGTITGAATSAVALTLSGNNTSTNNIISGVISPGTGLSSFTITKSGNGFWDLTGNNSTLTGTTTISGGTLSIGNNNALGTGNISLTGGALAADSSLTSLANSFTVSTNGGTTTAIYADIAGANNITTSGNLTFNGTAAAPSLFTNNMTSGATFTTTGTTSLANNGSTVGYVIFDGAGNTSLGAINGGPSGNTTIASKLDYYGSGTLTMNGANTSTGAQYLLGGTVVLNDTSVPLLSSATGAALTLGSNLQLNGSGVSESVHNTVIAGETGAIYNPSITSSGTNTIALGTITASTSPVLFQSGVATTTSADQSATATLGNWAIAETLGSPNQYDWATVNTATAGTATAITGLAAASYAQITTNSGATGTPSVLLNAGGQNFTNTGISALYELKIDATNSNSAGSFTLGRNNLSGGGVQFYQGGVAILYEGGAAYSINGDPLIGYPSTGNGSIYFQQYGTGVLTFNNILYSNTQLTISGASGPSETVTSITQSGNISVGLIKGGPGDLVLTANNQYGGPTQIAEGTLTISSDKNIGGVSGTVTVSSFSGTNNTTVTLSAAPTNDLVGATFLGTTVSAVSGATITLAAAPSTTTAGTYAYANGTQYLALDGTLEATGTFTLGETATSGSSTVTTSRPVYLDVDGGTFQVDSTNVLTVPGIVAPGGTTGVTSDVTLTKTGTGTLILSGANTYAGTTTVSAGTLLANTAYAANTSSTGQGNVIVANGATLGGSGVIAPNSITTSNPGWVPGASVTIQSGGTLNPGSTPVGSAPTGNLTLGSSTTNTTYSPVALNLNSGAKLTFNLGASNASSELVLSINNPGEVVFNSNMVSINDLTTGNALSGNYILIAPTTSNAGGTDYTGLTVNGSNVITGGLTLNSTFTSTYVGSYLFENSLNGDIELSVAAVPEPGTWALIIFGCVVLAGYRYRQDKLSRNPIIS